MARKPPRVPGLESTRSFEIPLCRVHLKKCERNEDGDWFCYRCFKEHVEQVIQAKGGQKTKSGIHLPQGVIDPAKRDINVREVLPNRAERRRRQKIRRRLERKHGSS